MILVNFVPNYGYSGYKNDIYVIKPILQSIS